MTNILDEEKYNQYLLQRKGVKFIRLIAINLYKVDYTRRRKIYMDTAFRQQKSGEETWKKKIF